MRRWTWLAAALLIGLALGWRLLRPAPPAQDPPSTRRSRTQSATASGGSRTSTTSGVDAAAPLSDDPYAFTELRGRVVDTDSEEGIAGARLRVEEGERFRLEVLSDQAGYFRLGGLGPGLYVLRVEAEGYASKRYKIAKQPVLEDDEGIEVRLEAAMVVFGRASGPSEEPLEGVVVGIHTTSAGVEGHRRVTTTARDGTYELAEVPLGASYLSAHHPARGAMEVPIEAPSPPRTRVDLRFAPAAALTGRVLGPSGPIAGAWVWLSPPAPARMCAQEDVAPYATRTDPTGRFGLPSNQRYVSLVAWASGYQSQALLLQGEREVELRLEPSVELRVRVVGRGGRPAAGVSVRVSETDRRGDCTVSTNEAGEARLVDLSPGAVAVAVESGAGGWRLERAELLPGIENALTVHAEGGGRITGHVVNQRSGERVTRFMLLLESEGALASLVNQSPSGSFALEGLREGTWTLRLHASDFRRRTLTGLVVREGELALGAVELMPLAQLQGWVRPAPGDALVVGELIDRASNHRAPFAVEPDGRFEVKVVGGSYDVELRDGAERLRGAAHWTVTDGEVQRGLVVELREF